MKSTLFFVTILIVILASCEKYNYSAYNEVLLKIENGLEYKYSGFDLYDSSTHILYFKNNHPEFKTESTEKFTVYANGEEIYQGPFLPGYSSWLPAGPFIYSFPYFYQNYALRIECWFLGDKQDLRNDSRIIEAFKDHDLLHSGLSLEIDPLDVTSLNLPFKFTITNHDNADLLILDIDKTGPNLFHYFTNGLRIIDSDNKEVFKSNIEHLTPVPWDSWKTEWLSLLKSGESRQFTINYTLNTSLKNGDYKAIFEFPGLAFQISKDQLYQNGKRIWLGDIQTSKKITFK